MGGGGHDSHGHGPAPAEPIIPAGSLQDHVLAGIALAAMIGIGWWTSELTQPITVIPAHGCHGDSHAAGNGSHGPAADTHGAADSHGSATEAAHQTTPDEGHGSLSTGQEIKSPPTQEHH